MLCQRFTLRSLRSLLALIAVCIGANALAAQSYPPKISGATEYVYKTADGFDLKLWVFSPRDAQAGAPVPAMLFFFGGGWNGGSPTQFVRQSQHLAKRGMVGIVADYRVKSRQGVRAVSCVEDALDALRYVTANAGKLGIDPDRIGVGGGSAGGHLAASLGTIHKDDPAAPKAMALYNPATILASLPSGFITAPRFADMVNEIKARIASKKGELRVRLGVEPIELSPFHHVDASTPPAVIFHGTNDTTVPYATALLFATQLKANNVPVDLKTYKGAGHGFFNREPYLSQTMEQLDAFFVSLGWLQ
ncbi:MAG: alpha/beta hydrolase fold domain-containing protein [Verrucomicrobia bacterium]|nr:alpha/beta hydrolase fold domain-containing protein [Verrucomicrobiota bacterium]